VTVLERRPNGTGAPLDAVIVGAGFAGLYTLHKLRGLGLSALVLEAALGVGGTWYANRFPGARADIQSLEYSFSFDEALQQEWHWSERYASQPELLQYANHVADRFGLRDGIRLDTRVTSAHFDDALQRWQVASGDGQRWTARFLVMASGYYETFNRPNVSLVDVSEQPIAAVTSCGLRTGGHEQHRFDMLVLATGFDAVTGTLMRLDLRGRAGLRIQDAWRDGPVNFLGLTVAGFPNLFNIAGAGSTSAFTSVIVSIEHHVDWIADCIRWLDTTGHATIEAGEQAQSDWVAHVNAVARQTVFMSCNSWYLGANIPGKPRMFMPLAGGFPAYAERCAEVAANGYEGFVLGRPRHNAGH
jgi:cation diffusion facilitator CzcD-associated flavoprotein CzcO